MKGKWHIIITLAVIIVLSTFTIGYAALSSNLGILGNVSVLKNDKEIKITSVVLIDSKNLVSGQIPTFSNTNIDFNLFFDSNVNPKKNQIYYAEYQVTLLNDTYYSYIYNEPTFNLQTDANHSANVTIIKTVLGISVGDEIAPGAQIIYTIRIEIDPSLDNAPYPINGSYTLNLSEPSKGQLVGSIPLGATGDVTNNQIAAFSATIINSYQVDKTITLESTKADFSVTNQTGGSAGSFIINAGEEKTITFYIKNNKPTGFVSSPQSLPIKMKSSGNPDSVIGSVSLTVPINPNLVDADPPIISNVTVTQSTTPYNGVLNWTATDDNTITSFTIITYKETNGSFSEVSRTNVSGTLRSYNLTNLTESKYYFTIFGTDSLGNSATANDIANASTAQGFATRCSDITFLWYASVKFTLSNMTAYNSSNQNITNGTETLLNQSFSFRLSATGASNLPSSITIRMNGTQLTQGSDYTYNSSNGQVAINLVTGPVTVEGSASCLVKGTKILLANGKYKNIEDVTYYDLLTVWNYKEGKKGYAYPVWMEGKGKSDTYLKSSFSDGTYLKTVGTHSVFNISKNRFISIDDPYLEIGDEIAKINKNGKIYGVKLIKQEIIKEDVTYYHVITPYNHNVFANDFITTDGNALFANVYEFGKNIKWNKDEFDKAITDRYSYDEFKSLIPYTIFKGLRLGEGGHFREILSRDVFKYYIYVSIMKNKNLIYPPVNKENKKVWMLTISTSDVNNILEKKLITEEGYYIFPIKEGVKYYLDSSNGDKYLPGTPVKIWYSMHFIEIK